MAKKRSKYYLTIALSTLEHLGLNLYSNVPSVLSEAIANAWDADATEVTVNWDDGREVITISDDGSGMSSNEVNERFLKVGYKRRASQAGLTPRFQRRPMGRKGIGKLSLFSIADSVTVETAKNAHEQGAFRMRLSKIQESFEQDQDRAEYFPEELPTDSIDFDHGTRITLSDLRKRVTISTAQALRRRVAQRFTMIGAEENFKVLVNGTVVTPADCEYLQNIQYLWSFGNIERIRPYLSDDTVVKTPGSLELPEGLKVTGWIATVRKVQHLKVDNENLSRISIFTRNKLVHEDILPSLSENGVYTHYLIGELEVDGLDTWEGDEASRDDDAVTSDRQSLLETDPRFAVLQSAVKDQLKVVEREWSDLRSRDAVQEASQMSGIDLWLSTLGPDDQRKAKRWIGKIGQARIDDDRAKKELYKQAVIGFEFYRSRRSLDELEEFESVDIEAIAAALGHIDRLETTLYGQIVSKRIDVINQLRGVVDSNELERVVQRLIFNHLWLLDPSWERNEGTELRMEQSVMRVIDEIDDSASQPANRDRIDIRYKRAAGQHVIVELKRAGVRTTTDNLLSQIRRYYGPITEAIHRTNPSRHDPLEFVVLLGQKPTDWTSESLEQIARQQFAQFNARVLFYDQLILDAENSYREYLEESSSIDPLRTILQSIEDPDV